MNHKTKSQPVSLADLKSEAEDIVNLAHLLTIAEYEVFLVSSAMYKMHTFFGIDDFLSVTSRGDVDKLAVPFAALLNGGAFEHDEWAALIWALTGESPYGYLVEDWKFKEPVLNAILAATVL